MISVRHHVVSVAAVFLALAVGVVLGSTSLSERLLSGVVASREQMSNQVGGLRADREQLRAQLTNAQRFEASVAPLAVKGQLAQRSVILLADRNVPAGERAAMRELLESSGAGVTGEILLNDALMDLNRADQLRTLVSGLLPAGQQLPVSADPGRLAGGLLGGLTLLDHGAGKPQSTPEERETGLRGLADSGFVTVAGDVEPAELAVILADGKPSGNRAGDRAATLARLAAQLDRSGAGAVLAGRSGSADGQGAVATVRADASISQALSTVDNLDRSAGQVAAVLALREQWEREAGHYGAAGSADGVVPNVRG